MQAQCVDSQKGVDDYFELSWKYWKQVYSDEGLLPAIYRERLKTAQDWIAKLGLGADSRILEVGCGAGHNAIALAVNGHTVDAMDSALAMLHATRNLAAAFDVQDQIRLYLADVHSLPFKANTFDLVIALGVIPWLHSEGAAVSEMRRVLKPGGYLLMSADNDGRLNRILDPLSCPLLAPFRVSAKRVLRTLGFCHRNADFQPKRHHPGEVDRLLHRSDFTKLAACTIGFGPFTFFGKQLFADNVGLALHARLQTIAVRQGWSPLRWKGSHYLVLGVCASKQRMPIRSASVRSA